MLRAIERATGVEYKANRIDGGYEVYTTDGKKYKKVKDSTFKRYFKLTGDVDEDKKEEKTEEKVTEKTEEISPEKREKMMEKIRKILALAKDNPSMEEGLAAALQAQKLMAKYNIHKEDVELEEIKDKITSVFSSQKHNSHLKNWRKQLALVIARNFRCKCYLSGKDIVFRGYKQDAEIALEVYLNLYTICQKLASQAHNEQKKDQGTGKGANTSFAMGFIKGVEEGLSGQCTALMIIVPKEVEDEFAEFSKGFTKGKATHVSVTDAELYQKGRREGKAAVKARQLSDKAS